MSDTEQKDTASDETENTSSETTDTNTPEDASTETGSEDVNSDFDQSAVDAMLGDTFNASEVAQKNNGLERVIQAGFVSYERMPMLDNVFDRLTRFLSSRLRGYTNDTVDVTLDNTSTLRFGDFMGTVPTSSVFAVFKAEDWNGSGLFVLDDSLAYSIINTLMGGNKDTLKIHKNRPLTSLERDLIRNLINAVLDEFSRAFTPISEVEFRFDRIEASSSLAAIVRQSNACIISRFHIDLGDCNGRLDLLLPFSTLEPVRDKLSQQFTGENEGRDNIWENHLLSEIVEVQVKIKACFPQTSMKLGEVISLQKGSMIRIPVNPDKKFAVTLGCDGVEVAEGSLGRIRNKLAVNIDKRTLPPEDELTKDDLIQIAKTSTDDGDE